MLTYDNACSLFSYDPATGVVRRLMQTSSTGQIGPVGSMCANGYLHVQYDGHKYKLHRLAFLLVLGRWPIAQVDHVNRVRTDNRWCNLREATHWDNMQNKSLYGNNKSGVAGVSFDQKARRWRTERHYRVLGWFMTKDEAITAANKYDAGEWFTRC